MFANRHGIIEEIPHLAHIYQYIIDEKGTNTKKQIVFLER